MKKQGCPGCGSDKVMIQSAVPIDDRVFDKYPVGTAAWCLECGTLSIKREDSIEAHLPRQVERGRSSRGAAMDPTKGSRLKRLDELMAMFYQLLQSENLDGVMMVVDTESVNGASVMKHVSQYCHPENAAVIPVELKVVSRVAHEGLDWIPLWRTWLRAKFA